MGNAKYLVIQGPAERRNFWAERSLALALLSSLVGMIEFEGTGLFVFGETTDKIQEFYAKIPF